MVDLFCSLTIKVWGIMPRSRRATGHFYLLNRNCAYDLLQRSILMRGESIDLWR